jgi:hypothetical protein
MLVEWEIRGIFWLLGLFADYPENLWVISFARSSTQARQKGLTESVGKMTINKCL